MATLLNFDVAHFVMEMSDPKAVFLLAEIEASYIYLQYACIYSMVLHVHVINVMLVWTKCTCMLINI